MIQIWKLDSDYSEPMPANNLASLDTATAQLPEGLYTTFRTYKGGKYAIGFQAHLRRLYEPSDALGIRPAVARTNIGLRIGDLLPSDTESRVRLILSRAGDFYLIIEPLIPLGEEVYKRGVSAITVEGYRQQPGLKLTRFITESQAERRCVREARVFEGLLVCNGRILEGLTSNFFYSRSQIVSTAKYGVLPGVTRKRILRILKDASFRISYRALRLIDLDQIDEAFITSSSRGVVPVVRINDLRIGSGIVGDLTRRLILLYDSELDRLIEPIK